MMSVLADKLSEVFHIQSPVTSEEICAKTRTMWMSFQTEPLQNQ